jgi:hypothetical protein
MQKSILFIALCYLSVHCSVLAQSTEIRPGIVLPQMTTAQRTSIASPANGMLVFDTNTQSYWFRQSGNWVNLSASGSSFWQQTGTLGNEIKNTNTGGFWSATPTTVTTDPGVIYPPTSGGGTRLFWMPAKGAFRAGTVSGSFWDAGNIGLLSFATGYNTTASGEASTALGSYTTASGNSSVALGLYTRANGDYSTASGRLTTASGEASTALGVGATASSEASMALGYGTKANGYCSVALGYYTTASGEASTALGYLARALHKRSIVIAGHSDELYTDSQVDNEMMMRFHTFRFWTQNTGKSVYFDGNGGVTATGPYTNVSDARLKQNIVPLNQSLQILSQLNGYHYTWKQDKTLPELQTGVLAQEVQAIFPELVHSDKQGTLSVNYTGFIPHLIEAVKELKNLNEELKTRNETLERKVETLQQLELRLNQLEANLKIMPNQSAKTDK